MRSNVQATMMPSVFLQFAVKAPRLDGTHTSCGVKQGFIGSMLALMLACSPGVRADWSDDLDQIRELMMAGKYAAAEKASSQSLAKGPSGLMSGTGTLVIHHWRGRARLLLGDAPGAIKDADEIIKANASIVTPDLGYALRGMSKALAGDASGSIADFEAALAAAQKGLGGSGRTAAVLGDRAFAKILLNDLDGADVDLSKAITAKYGSLMAAYMNARKKSLENTKSAVSSDLSPAFDPLWLRETTSYHAAFCANTAGGI